MPIFIVLALNPGGPGLPISGVTAGMAGREWKGIRDHREWASLVPLSFSLPHLLPDPPACSLPLLLQLLLMFPSYVSPEVWSLFSPTAKSPLQCAYKYHRLPWPRCWHLCWTNSSPWSTSHHLFRRCSATPSGPYRGWNRACTTTSHPAPHRSAAVWQA